MATHVNLDNLLGALIKKSTIVNYKLRIIIWFLLEYQVVINYKFRSYFLNFTYYHNIIAFYFFEDVFLLKKFAFNLKKVIFAFFDSLSLAVIDNR